MRRTCISLLAIAVMTAPARAIPSAALSTIPRHIVLVAQDAGVPDLATGEFTILVRDAANNPLNSRIEVRLQNCPGARVAVDQLQPGVTSQCATSGIIVMADQEGTAHLAAVGGGDASAPHGGGPCAGIYADGFLLGFVSVGYMDENGRDGLGAGDLSVWLTDFVTGDPIARSDFDGDGTVGAMDLSVWLAAWSGGRQVHSASAYCP